MQNFGRIFDGFVACVSSPMFCLQNDVTAIGNIPCVKTKLGTRNHFYGGPVVPNIAIIQNSCWHSVAV